MGSSGRRVLKAQKAPNATVNIIIISIQNRKNDAIVPEGRKWLQTKVAVTGSRFRKKHHLKMSCRVPLSLVRLSSCSQTLASILSPHVVWGVLWNDREISISLYSQAFVKRLHLKPPCTRWVIHVVVLQTFSHSIRWRVNQWADKTSTGHSKKRNTCVGYKPLCFKPLFSF